MARSYKTIIQSTTTNTSKYSIEFKAFTIGIKYVVLVLEYY